jgi:calcineurin-like phosphoesterase family protein
MLAVVACGLAFFHSSSQAQEQSSDFRPVDLQQQAAAPFRFIAYADTRFTRDTEASSPAVRQALVKAIADARPAFVSVVGDITYNGNDANDWKVWDKETSIWRDNKIPVYPAIGNHELHGNLKVALGNYFQRFPDLRGSRYYSVRIANAQLLVLDSALDETSGPQGQWLAHKLDTVPDDVDFVFVLFHHPPYTSSSDAHEFGGGHSARSSEQALARTLEARQQKLHARIVVFSGHVHNYERHEHGGVSYFVCGGGGAHAYPIHRDPGDPYQSKEVNFGYLLVEVDHQKLKVTMSRLDPSSRQVAWTHPDSVTIVAPVAEKATAAGAR